MSRRGVFLSWVGSHGRSHDLATALELDEVNYPPRLAVLPRAARYAAAAVWTCWVLVRRRPAALVVMSPPPIPVLLAALYCRLLRRPLVVDAHSGAVNRRAWQRLSRLSLRLLDSCAHGAVVVTNDEMRDEVEGWTRKPVIQLHDLLHPAPPAAGQAPRGPDVFVVCSWSDDEPLGTLAAALAQLRGLRVVVSGRPPSEAARDQLAAAGAEVPGFLSDDVYARTLAGAGAVMALTTRAGTMQRGGYEAASAGKALITSDTRVLREYFGPAAVYSSDEPARLAAAVQEALGRQAELEAAMAELRDARMASQAAGLTDLKRVLHPHA